MSNYVPTSIDHDHDGVNIPLDNYSGETWPGSLSNGVTSISKIYDSDKDLFDNYSSEDDEKDSEDDKKTTKITSIEDAIHCEDDEDELLTSKRNSIFESKRVRECFNSCIDMIEKSFDMIQNRVGLGGLRGVSDCVITKNIGRSLVTYHNRNIRCPNLTKFSMYRHDKTQNKEVMTSRINKDMYSVPLKSILLASDHNQIKKIAEELVDTKVRDSCVVPQRYMLTYCSKLDSGLNSKIRTQVHQFLYSIFDEEKEILLTLTTKWKLCEVVILFDRTKMGLREIKSIKNIIGCCVFSYDKKCKMGFVDYLAVTKKDRGRSIGTLLMHISQKLMSFDCDKDEFITSLCCRPELTTLYERYGFTSQSNKDYVKKGSLLRSGSRHTNTTFHRAGLRHNMKGWYDPKCDDNHQSMVIMNTKFIGERYCNYIQYPFYSKDKSWFIENIKNETFSTNMNSIVSTELELKMAEDSNELLFSKVTEIDTKRIENYDCAESYAYNFFDKQLKYFQIGNIFNEVVNKCNEKEDNTFKIDKNSTGSMLEYCEINLTPSLNAYLSDDPTLEEMWVQLKCKKCNKKVYVKKEKNKLFHKEMLNIIYSIWTVHVYGIEIDDTNEWFKLNNNWNQCSGRNDDYFESVKDAAKRDKSKFPTISGRIIAYTINANILQELFIKMFSYHIEMFKCSLSKAIAIGCLIEEKQVEVEEKDKDKRSINRLNGILDSTNIAAQDETNVALLDSEVIIKKKTTTVYNSVNKMTGTIGGTGHGGAIYGEITMKSMQRIVELMKKYADFNKDSRFIDVGCGLGKPNLHVAQDPQVEFSYGIEMEHVRWMLGLSNLNEVFSLKKRQVITKMNAASEESISYKCYLAHGNITEARYFDPFTHVYMFDIG